MSEKIYTHGCIQDEDGVMTAHMHPPGESFESVVGDGKPGDPCSWCERGVPLYGAVKRTVKGNRVTISDVETGQGLSVAEV